MVECTNCDFFVPDEPASNFKDKDGLTCPKCHTIWQTKEDYLEEKKRFSELFQKYSPIKHVYKNGKFVEMKFDPEMMDKLIEEFVEMYN